ncbi:hypothetical protein HanPSC8_Chr01g0012221 [Helianthus annuus]|nr:hypothetical protein HanPSC8_Chr01g0012221 [Helianthus annuus]
MKRVAKFKLLACTSYFQNLRGILMLMNALSLNGHLLLLTQHLSRLFLTTRS